jgi:proteasome assembly chaperone (PAC2) family protein
MAEELKLNHPWLVAVWPGMGHVAISAGYYLLTKLGMHVLAEFSPRELFDVENVEVKKGLIRTGRLPRSRFFLWNDPAGKRDIVIFIGEAQPPMGKYAFCKKLIEFAQQLGVERVVTFAAMATQMHPQNHPRVFAAATNRETLDELKELKLEVQEDGQIGGLNGILLGVAAEAGLSGACLLGEMPHLFAQLPFPAAAMAVLNVFTKMAGIELDMMELSQQADAMGEKLAEILSTIEKTMSERGEEEEDEEEDFSPPPEEPRISPADEERIERLFAEVEKDKTKAYELKQVLDQMDLFKDYEDRFLDLFKKKS